MIGSWIAKGMVRKSLDQMGAQGDAETGFSSLASNVTFDAALDLSEGVTLQSKREVMEWYRKWYAQYPQRKFIVKNIAFAAWPMSLSNVVMVEWTCEETDKEERQFKYDGVSVTEMDGGQGVRVTEYIACRGLPSITSLMKPSGKA